MSDISPWISVGALGEAFAPESNVLSCVNDLEGKTIIFNFENGWSIAHQFLANGQLKWHGIDGEVVGEQGDELYSATSLRPGIYFVDFVKAAERATTVSMIIDLNKKIFTALLGQLPERAQAMEPFLTKIAGNKSLSSVSAHFMRGALDQPFTSATERHALTLELIGKRVHYTYSATEKYEHTYLNANFYAWQCLQGSELGLADTDLCHYYKIDEQLYWFIWQEKIVPTLGVVMLDLQQLKTTGKIFGYSSHDFGPTSNFPVGAYARVVSDAPAA